jgi:TPR repeat protein
MEWIIPVALFEKVGTEQEIEKKPFLLYKMSTEKGNATAKYHMRNCSGFDWECKQSWEEAAKWQKKSAEGGWSEGKARNNFFHRKGHGV